MKEHGKGHTGVHHHGVHAGVHAAIGVDTSNAFENIVESTWAQHKRR